MSVVSASPDVQILEQYVTGFPSIQQALDIFKGEWVSEIPPADVLQSGSIPLFNDHRIEWLLTQTSVAGKRVLELGPLECGHSYMLHNAGVREIIAVEGNTRALYKCLLVKEIFALDRLKLLCGDIVEYLAATEEKFDLCLALGVLYHMREPGRMIEMAAKVAPRMMLWTHFYQADSISEDTAKLFGKPEEATALGLTYKVYPKSYGSALDLVNFSGGNANFANWIEKDTILELLRRAGLTDIRIMNVHLHHPNGPSFTLYACAPNAEEGSSTDLAVEGNELLRKRSEALSEKIRGSETNSQLNRLEQEAERLCEELAEVRGELEKIRNSASWRMTGPLRSIRRLFK
jgi:hypothetical protein